MSRPQPKTRDEIRNLDRYAIEELGVPGVVLMENAGRQAADVVAAELRDTGRSRAAILCGAGNNGGDGFVVARHLLRDGFEPRVYLAVGESKLRGDALINCGIWRKLGGALIPIRTADQITRAVTDWTDDAVIVDALLGTGFSGEVRSPMDQIIEAINGLNARRVVAIDVPSGLDCDTGKPSTATVRANVTVTFAALKMGFGAPGADQYTGRVILADIGVPSP